MIFRFFHNPRHPILGTSLKRFQFCRVFRRSAPAQAEKLHVNGSQRTHWRGTPRIFRALSNHVCHCEEAIGRRGNPYLKAFPAGEGGSHVSRKCETDEGYLPLPMGEAPGRGGEGSICPLSHFVTAPQSGRQGGSEGKRIATPVCGLVRNDMRDTGVPRISRGLPHQ